jgi:hypothetical protein
MTLLRLRKKISRNEKIMRFQAAQKRLISLTSVTSTATKLANPVIFYTRVGASFLKQTADASHLLKFPDPAQGITGITGFLNGLTSGAWRKTTLKEAGQYLQEVVKIGGFFLVGEMIGRGSVIGYQIPGTSHDDHH